MKTIMRLSVAAIALAGATCSGVTASHAYGTAPWCAVVNIGGVMRWDCDYQSIDECMPNVLAGNRGFCNLNPEYRAPADPTAMTYPKHHKPRAQQ
jgi:hypothetical protein